MTKSERIQVRLDPSLDKSIERLSNDSGFSKSEIGYLAIREGIDAVMSRLYSFKRPVTAQPPYPSEAQQVTA